VFLHDPRECGVCGDSFGDGVRYTSPDPDDERFYCTNCIDEVVEAHEADRIDSILPDDPNAKHEPIPEDDIPF
jgi:hypothetical protein